MKLLRSILILSVLSIQIQSEHAFSIPTSLKQVVGYISSTLDNKTTRYYGSCIRNRSIDTFQFFKKKASNFKSFSLFSLVASFWQKEHSVSKDLKYQKNNQKIHQKTINNLTFEKLSTILLSPAVSSEWEELLENKNLHGTISTLIANDFKELIKLATRLSKEEDLIIVAIRLGRFFDITDDKRGKGFIREAVVNNFGVLIDALVFQNNNLNIILRDFIERFVFFEESDNFPEICDLHYDVIFKHTFLYKRNKGLIIERLLSKSSSKKEVTLEWIKKHIDELEFDIVDFILEQLKDSDDLERLLRFLYDKNKDNFLKLVIIKRLEEKFCPSLELDIHPHTVHERYLIRTYDLRDKSKIINNYIKDLKLNNLFDKVNEKTKELQDNYYIFIHAQNIKFYPLQQWYTALRSLIEVSKLSQDYCYPWVVKLQSQDNFSLWYGDSKELTLHEKLKNQGCYDNGLFINYSFFENIFINGACSAYYFCSNSNAGPTKNAVECLRYIFNSLTLNAIYEKYKDQLEKHAATFDQLSKYGNMLLIAVPKEKISQSVYLSNLDASRRKITIKGIGETDDMALIMETLEKNPEMIEEESLEIYGNKRFMEFCLLMTQSPHGGGLNPESGIKVIPFNCIEPEKLQAFEKEKNELLGMIKEDIEALKKAKSDEYKRLSKGSRL